MAAFTISAEWAQSLPWSLAGVKSATIDTSDTSFFVYVPLAAAVVARLREVQRQVLPDVAAHVDVDHITLCIRDKSSQLVGASVEASGLASVRALCAVTPPMVAALQGWGLFDGAHRDGAAATALVVLVDVPALTAFQVALCTALTAAGVRVARNHSFVPHITLGYLPQGRRPQTTLPQLTQDFQITSIGVATTQRHVVALAGGAP